MPPTLEPLIDIVVARAGGGGGICIVAVTWAGAPQEHCQGSQEGSVKVRRMCNALKTVAVSWHGWWIS